MVGNNQDTSEISFLEPYGHASPDTKLERYWKKISGPVTLTRKRVVEYDALSGMTFSPTRYFTKRFTIDNNYPSDDWIIEFFSNFVKTEFTDKRDDISLKDNFFPSIEEDIFVSDSFLEDFLSRTDWIDQIDINLGVASNEEEMAERIFDLLCHPKIGSIKNKINNDKKILINELIHAIKEKKRLLFILPGFPFKDQNIFRVPFSGDIPDMAEIAFLIRLHKLTQAFYQIHPYGIDVIVLSDGDLYCDIFGVSSCTVSSYIKRLKDYRNKFNMQGTVSILSLKELIDRASDDLFAWKLADYIGDRLKKFTSDTNSNIYKLFMILVSGMKWNSESRNLLSGVEADISWNLLTQKTPNVPSEYKDLWEEIDRKARNAAIKYASINLMLSKLNLIKNFFPDSIRGTVHPKPGQFALASSGGSFAWNGVAWSKNWPTDLDNIEVKPYFRLAEFSPIRVVKAANSGLPLFYTGGHCSQNLQAAKLVLPKTGWQLSEIYGRELILEDFSNFIELGSGDPNFSWERKLMDTEYFEKLFYFRLEHYKKYGFGLHGLWIDNQLIGQCGLQALNKDKDQIELVIFLRKNYTRSGIGTKLTSYIIRRCNEVGMKKLFVVIRDNNKAALSTANKFNAIPVEEIHHYGQKATIYKLI